jgi:hypothetical protein
MLAIKRRRKRRRVTSAAKLHHKTTLLSLPRQDCFTFFKEHKLNGSDLSFDFLYTHIKSVKGHLARGIVKRVCNRSGNREM